MNYSDITSNVDSTRTSLRRIARHDEPEFSCASILNSMERFVKTVSEMEETILIPRRLLDLAVGDAGDTIRLKAGNNVKETLANTDLYRLYHIVNQMKVELLWSKEDRIQSREEEDADKSVLVYQMNTETANRLGHARCPSTTSMQSIQSASSIASSLSSDSESDIGVENDSSLENEECIDLANSIANNFKHHLRGLHRSINRMTDVAQYLTLRYQVDVDGQI
ncbi:uncharacterized protein LOC124952974 isoform X1 [Vespa velutina]|uniref:uncharacterized protein LOC124952974 isoform X1 n=1 Tax=Vespa velutina TaxID=202808 RepID=UPI001FB3A5A0|nr:uncharacterized protein LOC124952974 isoform X1 [Vespa velutina]